MAFPSTGTPGEIYIDPVSGQKYQYDSAGNYWARVPNSGGALVHEDVAITTLGQTAFALLTIPTDALSVVANVNGTAYFQPDFSILGNFITWAGPFALETTDRLVFTYV